MEVRDNLQGTATSPITKLFVGVVVDVPFKPLGIAMKGSIQYSTAPDLDQVRVLDTKTGDRVGPVQLPAGSKPTGIAVAADGNLWVTLNGSGEVAKVTASNLQVQKWAVGDKPYGIALSPAGEVWFTLQGQSQVGRLPSTGGTATLFEASANSTPAGLAIADDGTIWFTERDLGRIGRIKTGSSQVEEWKCAHENAHPEEILVTPGGQVYYNDRANSAVVAFTAAEQPQGSLPLNEAQVHAIREEELRTSMERFPGRGKEPQSMVASAPLNQGALSRAFAYGLDPEGGPAGIAMDGSGRVWLTQQGTGKVTRVSSDGSTYTFALPSSLSQPSGITVGTGGDVWVTLPGTNQMAQVPTSQPIAVTINAREPKRALKGELLKLAALVTGTTNPSVTWEVLEPAGGNITQAGFYTAPATPGTYHVIARSQADPSKYGRLEVVVYPWTAWPAGQITLLAGNVDGPGNVDGVSTSARFNRAWGVAVNGSGDVFVADTDSHTIRKVTQTGVVSTFAGAAGNVGSANGIGTSARFYQPMGLAMDQGGNLYVTEYNNHTIRKVAPTGAVSLVAGSPLQSGSANGTVSEARFNSPRGVTFDPAGNIYVADSGNHVIRKISPAGMVSTLAGLAGTTGSADGSGTQAKFYSPTGLATDAAGNVYVADTNNHTVRKISQSGVVITLAGLAGNQGMVNGMGTSARFSNPGAITVDALGTIFVGDSFGIRKITPGGFVSAFVGGTTGWADGTGSAAKFDWPTSLALDGSNNLYTTDTGNYVLRKITSSGVVNTIAGAPLITGTQDGWGTEARFSYANGTAVDKSGKLYVTEYSQLRQVSSSGQVNTIPSGTFYSLGDVAVAANGDVFVTDTNRHVIFRRDSTTSTWGVFAGSPDQSGSANGVAGEARFNAPIGIDIDGSGNLYVADLYNHTVRMITPGAVVSTLAGSPGSWGTTDAQGSAARFTGPRYVAADGAGNVYVTQWDAIRKITASGVVSTIARNLSGQGFLDGQASAAKFNRLQGICVDSKGNLFVADCNNNVIRQITPEGFVATLIGDIGSGINRPGFLRDGVDLPLPATYGALALPRQISIAPDGSLYITAAGGVMKVTFTP